MWLLLETLLEPGINCLAEEIGGVAKAGRERESRKGERGTILAGGSPNFLATAALKTSFAETDVIPWLSPDILRISVLSLNTLGALEWNPVCLHLWWDQSSLLTTLRGCGLCDHFLGGRGSLLGMVALGNLTV